LGSGGKYGYGHGSENGGSEGRFNKSASFHGRDCTTKAEATSCKNESAPNQPGRSHGLFDGARREASAAALGGLRLELEAQTELHDARVV
jgi:hypothetical protein